MESRNDSESRGYFKSYYDSIPITYSKGEYNSSTGEYDEEVDRSSSYVSKDDSDIEMIDELIRKLQYKPKIKTARISASLNERVKRINELKRLREEIIREQQEYEEMCRIDEVTEEVDNWVYQYKQRRCNRE